MLSSHPKHDRTGSLPPLGKDEGQGEELEVFLIHFWGTEQKIPSMCGNVRNAGKSGKTSMLGETHKI